jgi:hypothetical protein
MKKTLTTSIPELIGWAIGTSRPDSTIMAELISGCATENISLFLRYHGLTPYLAKYVRDHDIHLTDGIWDELARYYRSTIAHNILLEQGYIRFSVMMLKNNIPILPLKGIHFIAVSKAQTCYRPMCDIDILIKPEDYERCESLMLKNGFQHCHKKDDHRYWRKEQMHLAFWKIGPDGKILFAVEVHWALDYPRRYPILPELWERVRFVQHDGQNIPVMSHADALFVLALHQRRFGSLLQLKYVIDVGGIFLHYGKELDQNYILEEAQRSKLNSVLYALLAQTAPFYNDDIMNTLLLKLRVGRKKRGRVRAFFERHQYHVGFERSSKVLFAIFHCLLFDSWLEPITHMLFIPYEQFCKYYDLDPRRFPSRMKYEVRHFYGLYRILRGIRV